MGVERYRDTLTWTGEGTPTTTDPVTGDPVPGTPGATLMAACRYEDFRGRVVKQWVNSDGETVLQTGTVYVRDKEVLPPRFEKIKVDSPEFGTVFQGEALNVYRGQLNCTIAVAV